MEAVPDVPKPPDHFSVPMRLEALAPASRFPTSLYVCVQVLVEIGLNFNGCLTRDIDVCPCLVGLLIEWITHSDRVILHLVTDADRQKKSSS